jgi:hypothetical protein
MSATKIPSAYWIASINNNDAMTRPHYAILNRIDLFGKGRDQVFDQLLFVVGHIVRKSQLAMVVTSAVLARPH